MLPFGGPMRRSFLKALISFILLVCSAAVLVYGLFFLQTPTSRQPAPSALAEKPGAETGTEAIPPGSSGVTPSGGVR